MVELIRENLDNTYHRALPGLLEDAWQIRKNNFNDHIVFAAPGSKIYKNEYYNNNPLDFVNISVTEKHCQLSCEHCRGKLLENMYPVKNNQDMIRLGELLKKRKTRGVLISGGADKNGSVPLEGYEEGIAFLKSLGLKVLVHTGLVKESTGQILKRCGVDLVMLDFIGDLATIQNVYHLSKTVEDYEYSLKVLKAVGLQAAPHIVIGLNFGALAGELEAFYRIMKVGVSMLVLVVLTPLSGTPMAKVKGPTPEEVGRLLGTARIFAPTTRVVLGCARPAGPPKSLMEKYAISAGVNGIAFPEPETIAYTQKRGLQYHFTSLCCSLAI